MSTGSIKDKVRCKECGYEAYSLVEHLRHRHNMTPGQYTQRYQGQLHTSKWLEDRLQAARRERTPVIQRTPLEDLQVDAEMRSKMPAKTPEMDLPTAVPAEKVELTPMPVSGDFWIPPGTKMRLPIDKTNTTAASPKIPWQVPEELADFCWAYTQRTNVYIMGESGLGKSFMVRQVFAHTKQRYYEVTSHGDATTALLIGCMSIENGNTKFVRGALPKAMEEGVPLLWEEMDRTPARVTTIVHTVASEGKLVIEETGETVTAKPGFCIIATGNTKGRGDTSGRYGSAEVMDAALLSRFQTKIEMEMLSRNAQLILMTTLFPKFSRPVLEKVLNACESIRKGCEKAEFFGSFGVRDQINFVRHLEAFPPEKAIKLSYANLMDTTDAQAVITIVKNSLGSTKLM